MDNKFKDLTYNLINIENINKFMASLENSKNFNLNHNLNSSEI